MGSVTTASTRCATSFTFCDEVEDFSFFSSFTFDFLLFGNSYSVTEEEKKGDRSEHLSDCSKMHPAISASFGGLEISSNSGYAASECTALSPEPSDQVFSRDPSTYLLLFPCSLSCSFFVFSILTTN